MDVSRGDVALVTAAADQADPELLPRRSLRVAVHVPPVDASELIVFGEHGFCVPLGPGDDTNRVPASGALSTDDFVHSSSAPTATTARLTTTEPTR